MMMLMLERGMDPPQMSPAPAVFFNTTSESLEPQTSFVPQPGDDVMDEANIEAATTTEEDEEADDEEEGDDLDDTDDLDNCYFSLFVFVFYFLLDYAQFYV